MWSRTSCSVGSGAQVWEERSEEGRSLGDHPPGQVLQEERPGLGQGHEGPAERAGGCRAWPRVSPASPLALL